MSISSPFIHRPIATSLLMLAVLLLGMTAYLFLPIAALPQIDIPTIEVSTSLPGASADTMATSVTAPLERQLSLIPNITEMTSSSSLGNSSITMQFDLHRNIDAAAQDVQGAINAALGQLPKTLPSPPSYEKANPADFLIMSLGVTSDTLPIQQVDLYADSYIAQQLSRIPGVGLIDLHGEQKPAVRVQLDPKKVAAMGISLEDIRSAVSVATNNAPKGTLDNDLRSITIDSTDQLIDAPQYENVIVAYHNGAAVHIRDIGRAVNGVEDIKQAAWVGTKRGIVLDIHKQYGFNVVETIDAIKAALPTITSGLPADVHVEVISDRTQTIRASVNDVKKTFYLTVILVVFIIFAFLRSLWATVIAVVAIPLSVIGTFAVMYALGYGINNISLMGLTIAVGFVIDDAVVMIENIVRHLNKGEKPLAAALEGARQISFTVISMTVSLIAVFIPLLLMSGVVGQYLRQFSVTVSVALLVSGFVSLTLTPAMCRLFLKSEKEHSAHSLTGLAERGFSAMLKFYEKTLDMALRWRGLILLLTILTAVVTCYLYFIIPKGFFPQQDTGFIMCTTEAAPDVSVPEMSRLQLEAVQIIKQDPDVAGIYSWVGGGTAVNNGRIMISLKPFDERKDNADQILTRLKKNLSSLSGISAHLQARQELQIGGRGSKTQFQYTLEDTSTKELYAWAPKLASILEGLPQLKDIAEDIDPSAPQAMVVIDRETAGRFGINPQVIDNVLYDAFGQRQIATILTEIDQYRVILEVDPKYRLDKSALDNIYVPASDGKLVPLSVVAHVEDSMAPLQNNHQDQFPAITLSFNLAPGYSLGDAVDAVDKAFSQAHLPLTLHGSFQGTAMAFKDTLATQPYLIMAAIIAVYIVLGILYESYIHPITILSTLPSAGLGALIALMLCRLDLNLISLVGIILLIGIVKKNAIMMIDFALDAEHKENLDAFSAIRQACLLRFRPIMMTTMAAIFGSIPLAFGHGAGSELRMPLGIAIVGGLIVSQILTLYTTPIIYLYLHRFCKKDLNS